MAPADFIPLAEETGLIVPIGDWVIQEACRQIAEWRSAGRREVRVAVNMAALSLGRDGFVDRIAASLRRFELPCGCLEIGITESVMMRDLDTSAAILAALKVLGVRVSVDEFVTGHSSLAYLKRLPIDTLKIDRSLIREVDSNREDAAIVTAIIVMARSLGLEVVAEGVETPAQAGFLRDRGCDLLQGYLYGRALPAGECRTGLESLELAA